MPKSSKNSTHSRKKVPISPPSEPGLPKLQNKRYTLRWIILSIFGVIILTLIIGFAVYQHALAPKDPSSEAKMRITVTSGENSTMIGDTLEKNNVIKSSFAFQIYTQITNTKQQLQAGTYLFSPSESIPQITKHLQEGKTDTFNVTILPGQSLKEIAKSLKKQGFSQKEIDDALSADYDHPVLKGKPKDASLEGFIFPETYQLNGDDTLQSLIIRSMDEFYAQLQEKNLLEGFEKQNLTPFQAMTLASIIQKEVASEKDEKQVSQIFLKRLADDIRLDADSTFVFAAKQQGKTPSVDFDSSYNTRVNKGLPPGPISNFNIAALDAVANPASGDYLYFVSGDDGTTYYARSLEEHEKNVRKYCKANCNLF